MTSGPFVNLESSATWLSQNRTKLETLIFCLWRITTTGPIYSCSNGNNNQNGATMSSAISDEDRRRRLRQLEADLRDPRSIINVDCLLDAVQSLVGDCDHPAIRKIKNIDAFVSRCKKYLISTAHLGECVTHSTVSSHCRQQDLLFGGRAENEALRFQHDQGHRSRCFWRGPTGQTQVDEKGLRHEVAQQIRDGERRHVVFTSVQSVKIFILIVQIKRSDSAFFWEERDIMAHANSEWLVQLHFAFQVRCMSLTVSLF